MGFHIEQSENPHEYKDQILRMWLEYLPGTPVERYNWLTLGNPAGRTRWFLALDDRSQELLGFITLMPRLFVLKGREVLFGIMGDFVVDKRHRGFGPGMQFPKYVLNNASELGFSLIYTIPYSSTIKNIERAGFNGKVHLRWLIRPLNLHRYVKSALAGYLLNFMAMVFDGVTHVLLLNPLTLRIFEFEEMETFGKEFDLFWERLKTCGYGVLAKRDASFLAWRYMDNPSMKFRVLVCRQRDSGNLLGYVIFSINDCKVDIYDVQFLQAKIKYLLIQRLIQIAKQRGCKALYILSSSRDDSLSGLRAFGFIASAEKHQLCYVALEPGLNLDSWRFFQCDRNE